jgi:hypothetical protein
VDGVDSAADHERLTDNLVSHIWAKRGVNVVESDGDSFGSEFGDAIPSD